MAVDELLNRFGRDFPAGQVLFNDGDSGREMYIVQSGRVRISKSSRGVEKTLIVLGAGEFFGEMSILNNQPRSATATIEETAKLLVIEPRVFEAMVKGNAEIAVRIIKKLAARLQEADEQIENLLLRDHNSRVVHYITHAVGKLPRAAAQEGTAQILEMTGKDIAGQIGLDPEPVNEVLSKLVRGKLLTLGDTNMTVHDVPKLQAFLEFLEMKERFGDV